MEIMALRGRKGKNLRMEIKGEKTGQTTRQAGRQTQTGRIKD